jgi:hypothetical protein
MKVAVIKFKFKSKMEKTRDLQRENAAPNQKVA